MKALTLRPRWAWFVVNGYKDIENRSWPTRLRGRIWIHASSSQVTRAEYAQFLSICRERRIKRFPQREGFKIGGIVGSVEIVDCVKASRSYWFSGPCGFVLKNARKTAFRPMKGRLGTWVKNVTGTMVGQTSGFIWNRVGNVSPYIEHDNADGTPRILHFTFKGAWVSENGGPTIEVREMYHLSFDANGELRVERDQVNCGESD